jgi:hypothetical protein
MIAVRWGKEGALAFEVVIPFFNGFKKLFELSISTGGFWSMQPTPKLKSLGVR